MRNPVTWIRKPETRPSGLTDHLAFVHVTELICKHTYDPYYGILGDIKDALEYLLLLRDPETGESRKPDHPISVEGASERVFTLRHAVARDLERGISGELIRPYGIIQLIYEMGRRRGQLWVQGEEPALMLMSLWLITRSIYRSDDLLTCKAGLRLMRLSKHTQHSTPDGEFRALVPGYIQWFVLESERIFETYERTEDIIRDVAYLGYLVTLIRACRMVDENDTLHAYLKDEESWMRMITRAVC